MEKTPSHLLEELPPSVTAWFIQVVLDYCEKSGRTPQNVLRKSYSAGWDTWSRWCDRKAFPTTETVDRVIAHMRANPPVPVSDPSQSQKKDVA